MKKLFPTIFALLLITSMYAQTPNANNVLFVNFAATGTGNGNTWTNAIPQLADALKHAKQQNNYTAANPLKIFVAKEPTNQNTHHKTDKT